MFSWLWTSFTDLFWWQMILWGAYFIYFVVRSFQIWQETSELGIKKGYKNIFFGENPDYFRLYHLIRMLFDIPPLLIGLLFPLLRSILTLKLYEFKKKEI